MKLKFIRNAKGKVLSAIVPIKDFEEMMDQLQDIEDLALIEERRDEPTIPWEVVRKKLKKRIKADAKKRMKKDKKKK